MLRIISWTGWTKDDWKLFGRYILNLPVKAIVRLGEFGYDKIWCPIVKGEIR